MGSTFCSSLGTCNKNHESPDNQVVFAELFKALSKLNQKLVGESDGLGLVGDDCGSPKKSLQVQDEGDEGVLACLDDDLIVGDVKGRQDTSMVGHVLTLLHKAMTIQGDQIKSKKKQSISDLKISRALMDKDPSKKLGKDYAAIQKVINFDPSSPNPKPKATNFM